MSLDGHPKDEIESDIRRESREEIRKTEKLRHGDLPTPTSQFSDKAKIQVSLSM